MVQHNRQTMHGQKSQATHQNITDLQGSYYSLGNFRSRVVLDDKWGQVGVAVDCLLQLFRDNSEFEFLGVGPEEIDVDLVHREVYQHITILYLLLNKDHIQVMIIVAGCTPAHQLPGTFDFALITVLVC